MMDDAGRSVERSAGRPEPAGAPGPLGECPACGWPDIEVVSDGEYTNFLCRSCFRCWHVELGRVSRVDPLSCPGCRYLDRCLDKLRTEPPPWGVAQGDVNGP